MPTEPNEIHVVTRRAFEEARLKNLISAAYHYNLTGALIRPEWLEEALEIARKFWKEEGRE